MSLYSIETKLLAKLARELTRSHPRLSSELYRVAGITTSLRQRLIHLKQYKESSIVDSNEVQALLDHILFLVKQGLAAVESRIMPITDQGQYGRMLQVMPAMLRASFYHILSQHHNSTTAALPHGRVADSEAIPTTRSTPRLRHTTQSVKQSPPEHTTSSGTSFLTNPWLSQSIAPPDKRPYNWKLEPLQSRRARENFLVPKQNHIPRTKGFFETACGLARRLAASSPLRLAVTLEYCMFLAECGEDRGAIAKLARQAVKECYECGDHIDEDDFEDAGELVQELRKLAGP